jgi:hypothetical protein
MGYPVPQGSVGSNPTPRTISCLGSFCFQYPVVPGSLVLPHDIDVVACHRYRRSFGYPCVLAQVDRRSKSGPVVSALLYEDVMVPAANRVLSYYKHAAVPRCDLAIDRVLTVVCQVRHVFKGNGQGTIVSYSAFDVVFWLGLADKQG